MREDASAGDVTRTVLSGGGEMGARIRAHNWSTTPLGPVDRWPQSLRSVVGMLLPSKAQIILFWGSDFTVLYNDAYRPVFGAKHPHALGLPGREAWSEIWDEMLHELLAGVVRTGEAFWAKDLLFVLERHGFVEETYFDVSYDPVRVESGAVGGVYCIVTETTERVVAAQRMALLKDLAAHSTLARTTRDACALAMETLAHHPHDILFALTYLDDALQACTPGAEARLTSANPEHVHELATISSSVAGPVGRLVVGLNPRRPFDTTHQAFLGLVAHQLGTAIASAHAYEEEKKRAEALAEIDRAKTAFFSNVSHEFRTPLTLILGPLEDMLADRATPPAQRERIDLVYRNSLRLLKLVNTLLEFSRIEAGRVQASFEPTDLAGLTTDLASAFRSAIERAGMELVVDCPPLGEPAYVDRDMWEEIVLNLLSNAFKYTLRGQIRVALGQNGGAVTLAVVDTGVGIPESELPRVFERFRRIEGVQGRTHEGTGIGLALVKELVKLHGGSVAVESVYGSGSTFVVTIPLGKAHLPAERIAVARQLTASARSALPYVEEALRWVPEAARPSSQVAHRARIILADDNADMREYVARLLRAHHDVEAVEDGDAALKSARRQRPDLILTDVMMPVMDGFGLLHEVRNDPALRTVPVLLLSARAGEEARVEGWEAGADDYLVKPFSARELVARVGTHLEMARIRREADARLRAELDAMTRLQRLGTLFVSEGNLEPVLGEIVDAAIAIAEADFGNVQLIDEATGDLRIVAQRGFEQWWLDYWHAVGEGRGSCGTALERGERVIVEDVTVSPMFAGTPALDAQLRAGVRAVQSTPLLSRSGRPLGMFSTHYRAPHRPTERALRLLDLLARQAADIVERGLSEAALRESEEKLRQADRRKDEFLATLAHELRNPLAPIRTGLEVIRLRGSTPESIEHIRDIMDRQVGHMVRLIDDLLDISRITSGKIELQRQPAALSELVDGAVEATRTFIAERQVHLTINVPEEPCMLDVDRTRFVQIVANLLHNAAKFTPPGGRIEVSASISQRDGPQSRELLVTVTDTGVGISQEILPHVFDLFTQDETATSPQHGGLGIGLALVRKLVEMHGGHVQARSEGRNRGTQVTIRLPMTHAPAAATPVSASSDQAAVGCRVLVVDDNEDAARTLAMLVKEFGGESHVANDGASGLDGLAQFQPQVVMLDIGMPGLDGYETCRRMREAPGGSDLIVVALTGWGQADDKQRAIEAGFNLHLTKPADPLAVRKLLAEFGRTRAQ
jgi:signal transduction histidine kinase/DNA-binding response OmpR family regulator